LEGGVIERKWAVLAKYLQAGWLVPLSDDDLFELYVLVFVLEVLSVELQFGKPLSVHLVRAGRGAVAILKRPRDSVTARVHFDQAPTTVFGTTVVSEYGKLLRKYAGISGSERRPDVTLVFSLPGGQERRLILEAKRTQDDQYRRDSVYKAFAYLYDFSSMWPSGPQRPKAIVVFPDEVNQVQGTPGDDEVAIMSGDDRLRLRDLMAVAIHGA
jgi:hypothetical protein